MPRKGSTCIPAEKQNLVIDLYKKGHGVWYISEIVGVHGTTIHRFLKRKGLNRSVQEIPKKHHYNEDFFETIDSEEKAYWLGFFYADGYLTSDKYSKRIGLSLGKKDRDHIEKFKRAINSDHIIHDYKTTGGYKIGTEYSRIMLTSSKMYNDLVKQGCFPHKSNILKGPNIESDLKSHFIRGYYDGDGGVTQTKSKAKKYSNAESPLIFYRIKITGTPELLDYIKEFIEENGVAKIKRYYQRKHGQIVRTLDFGGNIQVKNFLDLLYNDATVYLTHKYDRYVCLCNQDQESR
ncbi:LAGLIDADG family homing endonuclease [Selenomonas sp. AE3005]|uniref:LAGLIDADG family homing endonuclease n=1 Tax=Selenomonas sp. AE3005 TaxID=1485543 RepID=UPI00048793C7|nr:LAGLIDADG family homing endonuclease [Selenomonas sp. AE3005]